MANTGLVRKVFALSPYIELIARFIYWHNISHFRKARKNKPNDLSATKSYGSSLNYFALDKHLRTLGVEEGSLLVVHSSFASLKGRVSGPDEMIDFLLGIVGQEGTLAMPAMPIFKNARSVNDYISSEPDENVYFYDVQRSRIKTGALPSALHKRKGSIRSRHPINSMVAIGSSAEKLMEGNLAGDSPLACGINSSWQRCVENNAVIISIGTDLTHSLTMIHVAEDVKELQWPIKNWYIEKLFHIKDKDFEESRVLRERAPQWGALHFAERTLCRDLMAAGLLKSNVIDGVLIEAITAKALISFLDSRNHSGYPYFWISR